MVLSILASFILHTAYTLTIHKAISAGIFIRYKLLPCYSLHHSTQVCQCQNCVEVQLKLWESIKIEMNQPLINIKFLLISFPSKNVEYLLYFIRTWEPHGRTCKVSVTGFQRVINTKHWRRLFGLRGIITGHFSTFMLFIDNQRKQLSFRWISDSKTCEMITL